MKTACDEFRAAKVPALLQPLLALPVAPELLQLARNFVDLQAARQSADYDLRLILTRIEALTLVRAAEEAVASWQRVAAQPNSAVFLARLAGMVGTR